MSDTFRSKRHREGIDMATLALMRGDSAFAAAVAAAAAAAAALAAAGAAVQPIAMFFGQTAGTGNPLTPATDYSHTIAVRTGAGTGRMPFPRLGPTAGVNPPTALPAAGTPLEVNSYNLPTVGVYRVQFQCTFTEPGQLQVCINELALTNDLVTGRNMPTSGGTEVVGNFLLTTVAPNSVLTICNPPGNSPALTVTPADGASTHAFMQTLLITKVG
jgi:hypothetical protein